MAAAGNGRYVFKRRARPLQNGAGLFAFSDSFLLMDSAELGSACPSAPFLRGDLLHGPSDHAPVPVHDRNPEIGEHLFHDRKLALRKESAFLPELPQGQDEFAPRLWHLFSEGRLKHNPNAIREFGIGAGV
jgi:hypothetical protein